MVALAAGRNLEAIVRSRLGAALIRADGGCETVDHVLVERVLEVAARLLQSEQPAAIGLVLGEQPGRIAVAIQPVRA